MVGSFKESGRGILGFGKFNELRLLISYPIIAHCGEPIRESAENWSGTTAALFSVEFQSFEL